MQLERWPEALGKALKRQRVLRCGRMKADGKPCSQIVKVAGTACFIHSEETAEAAQKLAIKLEAERIARARESVRISEADARYAEAEAKFMRGVAMAAQAKVNALRQQAEQLRAEIVDLERKRSSHAGT
jgi:hypothetical protein